MKKLALLWFVGGLYLASSSDLASGNAGVEADQVVPVCAFPKIAASSVGEKLRVRGKMTLHAHGILLSDERCPDVRVHLKSIPDGPDISLCSVPHLVERFGCPAGGDAGPIVTAVGVLRNISEPDNGFLLVEQLVDYEGAGGAERR
jgi:hypothetical protein